MNKPTLMAMATLFILVGSAFALPIIQLANAQYGGGGPSNPGSGNLTEQVLLAKKKVQNAQQAGAYGSGTPMLGANLNVTVLFIGVLVVIFGGVAAAFFIMSRKGSKREATT